MFFFEHFIFYTVLVSMAASAARRRTRYLHIISLYFKLTPSPAVTSRKLWSARVRYDKCNATCSS